MNHQFHAPLWGERNTKSQILASGQVFGIPDICLSDTILLFSWVEQIKLAAKKTNNNRNPSWLMKDTDMHT